MPWSKRLGSFAVAVLIGALPAAGGGTAVAKKAKVKLGPVQTRSATGTTTGPQTIATATATCPKGTRAVGGGFNVTPPEPAFSRFSFVFESQKVGQKSWRVSSQELTGNRTTTLVAHVYCRKGAPKTSTVSASATNPGTVAQPGTPLLASCSGKKNAVAGGFLTSLPVQALLLRVVVLQSYRASAKSWLVQSFHNNAGSNSETTFAYCAQQKVPAAVTATSPPNGVDATISSIAAGCTGKKTPVAGGFSQTGFSGNSVFFPYESNAIAKTWQASGYKNATNPPVSLNAIAYCA